MPIIECVAYASKARIGLQDLSLLARWSRERNEGLGITGLLLYDSDYFFGYLEGDPQCVQRLHASIQTDPRHEQMRVLKRSEPTRRRFERWFMGYLYEPIFAGELGALWSGESALDDLEARLERWTREGDVL